MYKYNCDDRKRRLFATKLDADLGLDNQKQVAPPRQEPSLVIHTRGDATAKTVNGRCDMRQAIPEVLEFQAYVNHV